MELARGGGTHRQNDIYWRTPRPLPNGTCESCKLMKVQCVTTQKGDRMSCDRCYIRHRPCRGHTLSGEDRVKLKRTRRRVKDFNLGYPRYHPKGPCKRCLRRELFCTTTAAGHRKACDECYKIRNKCILVGESSSKLSSRATSRKGMTKNMSGTGVLRKCLMRGAISHCSRLG
ncbi:hypothetical protein AMATHDRAFT_87008 [Amanita thiersii Skay4041]|uniref:Zn(2)-C6 fungal-type domain-containing protein n=1 Tax=Amanita thiersii Skay4041 TaxID=703135 RepID=A0A2A9NLS0_9AGAR|nr:hypothetical protein AMATHDRAFT_87008 [Amanita thiersii Skay4041]